MARESWILMFVVVAVELVRDFAESERIFVASLLPIAVLGGLLVGIGSVGLSVHLSATGIHRFSKGVIRWSDIVRAERDGVVIRYEATIEGEARPVSRTLRLNPGVGDALHRWTDAGHPLRRALVGAAARRSIS